MRLTNILLRSRLFIDSNLIQLFIKNNLIYLNGTVCSNPNFQLFTGDFLQLIITIKYYILHKWFLSLNLKKKNRLKSIARSKSRTNRNSEEKKKSYNLPN
jgi:hypothetical protein